MIFLRVILSVIIGSILVLALFPDVRSLLGLNTKHTKESFLSIGSGIGDSGFNRRVAFETRQSLEKVGKEPLPRQPMFTDDPRMGNARRDLSRMPSVSGSGFSLPESYNQYDVPQYSDGYDVAVMNAPRTSETYHSPRSDAFHMYYQTLHDSLDGN